MMAARITGREPDAGGAQRASRSIARCCAPTRSTRACRSTEFGYDRGLRARWTSRTWSASSTTRRRAVIVQSPNFFGIVEDVQAAAEIAHRRGALLIVVFTEAVSLGMLEPPRDADIVAGELQSFAIPPSYGGPFAGIIATKEKFIRQMPGRLVGRDQGLARQPGLLPDARDARAAHPAREGDLQHLHQPGADRADGDGLHDGLRQAGPARTGRAESGQGALPGRASCSRASPGRSSTSSWRRPTAGRRKRSTRRCSKKKIIGGLPLGRFYPELDGLRCCCARRK